MSFRNWGDWLNPESTNDSLHHLSVKGKTRVGTVTEQTTGKALNPSLSDNLFISSREAWPAAAHGFSKNWIGLRD